MWRCDPVDTGGLKPPELKGSRTHNTELKLNLLPGGVDVYFYIWIRENIEVIERHESGRLIFVITFRVVVTCGCAGESQDVLFFFLWTCEVLLFALIHNLDAWPLSLCIFLWKCFITRMFDFYQCGRLNQVDVFISCHSCFIPDVYLHRTLCKSSGCLKPLVSFLLLVFFNVFQTIIMLDVYLEIMLCCVLMQWNVITLYMLNKSISHGYFFLNYTGLKKHKI